MYRFLNRKVRKTRWCTFLCLVTQTNPSELFGLVVDINSPTKGECEDILKACIMEHLDDLKADENVMLKLTIPTKVNLYEDCIAHPRTVLVVALSGGYSRDEANRLLAQQKGMVASFSRALSEGLSHGMSQVEFDKTLGNSVNSIYEASKAG